MKIPTEVTFYLCPRHGLLSQRELDDCAETAHTPTHADDDGLGEPYRCSIWVRDGTPSPNPGRECLEALECVEYELKAR